LPHRNLPPAYLSGEIWSHYLYNIVIWAPGNPPGIEERVRKALTEVDPNLVLYGVDPYTKVLSGDFQQENIIATLTTLFGVLGLLLAAVGLYGVMACMVEQRTGEIGIRMALGADRWRVVKMVLRRAFSQVGIGLALVISGSDRGRQADEGPTVQRKAVGPSHARVRYSAARVRSRACVSDSGARAAGVEPMVALRNE
jgi:putative ABC transport system permease protein